MTGELDWERQGDGRGNLPFEKSFGICADLCFGNELAQVFLSNSKAFN